MTFIIPVMKAVIAMRTRSSLFFLFVLFVRVDHGRDPVGNGHHDLDHDRDPFPGSPMFFLSL